MDIPIIPENYKIFGLCNFFRAMPPILDRQLNNLSNKEFFDGFIASFSIVIFSELFDKTFFIAAIMAMRHSRFLVFLGSATALFMMTVLSSCLGSLSMVLLPPKFCALVSCLIMYGFGFKMLNDAYKMDPNHAQDEIDDANEEIHKRKVDNAKIPNFNKKYSHNTGWFKKRIKKICDYFCLFLMTPYFQTLTMVFIGEWGDRSQLSTIVLASHKNIFAVSGGAFLGHCLCTGLAVLGGSLLSKTVSVKSITYFGSLSFLIFATYSLIYEL